MKTRFRILLIEDAAADAELITRELKASGLVFALTRIETESEFRQELSLRPPHLILSDHGLPSFDGFHALAITRAERPDLPFIFVSGSNDPYMVALMYEAGATDYVFKHDLSDLRSAVLEVLKANPDLWLLSTRDAGSQTQTELDLHLPANSAVGLLTSVGHLLFCPQCRRLRDETGNETGMENYCGTHPETIVVREVCRQCAENAPTS